VGAEAARQVFDRFSGRWQVAQIPENSAAMLFWRKGIECYTGGKYNEVVADSQRWQGPVHCFETA
jgi:predicted acetyltransferase